MEAFKHGAGFSPNDLAKLIATIGVIMVTAWMLWVQWSVFRGFKSGKTDKAKFLKVSQRTLLIWLIINFILVSGIY
ncbi:TIGR03758 family integrating conjugative element protein [Shewanella sairae]|nr:TIGR03758 family integrating conjugative element protein [Shewanella sairae]MCL1130475.1 TIGR03758 family integrating conjugative element protein [Shewanella sairae]